MFILIGLLTVSALICAYFYPKYARRLALAKNFIGPPAWPILGNALLFIGRDSEQILATVAGIVEKYGKTVRLWLGPELNILMCEMKDVEAVLGNIKYIDKAGEYHVLRPWLHEGLLVSTGKKWFKRRKIITPAFHFKILEQFLEVFDKHSNILVENLKKFQPHEHVDLANLVSLCTLDVICESAMGVTVNAQINSESKYVQAVKTISMVIHRRMFDVLLRFDFLFKWSPLARQQKDAIKTLHEFSDEVIVSRRKELLKSQADNLKLDDNESVYNNKRKMAFLDILLQSEVDGKPLSNLDIREEVDTFMFEGHDTTSSAIFFFFYNMAHHQEAQQKCYEEICDIFGSQETKNFNIANLNSLRYVELCIKETLRLFPSVPLLGRKINEECIINGKIIPAGTNIGISPLQIGRAESLYPKPEEFIPERFDVVVGGDKLNPYSFIPFSAGPRNCIGQKFAMLEIKCVIAKILRNFTIQIVDPKQQPILLVELILRTKEPLNFHLIPRN